MIKNGSSSKFLRWLTQHENIILIVLFSLFIVMTLPGISNVRNPDEIAHRVHKALLGEWAFDETNFDYPSLPKHVMFAAGQVSYELGYARDEFYVVVRTLSVLLGGLIIILSYKMTRKLGGNVFTAALASLLIISSSEFAINARFAHNDLYLIFFLLLIFGIIIKLLLLQLALCFCVRKPLFKYLSVIMPLLNYPNHNRNK